MKQAVVAATLLLATAVGRGQDGRWEPVGKPKDWAHTRAMAALGEHVYSLEEDGTLYATDASGAWKPVGATRDLSYGDVFAAGSGKLWVVVRKGRVGSLYRCDTAGAKELVGKKGEWGATRFMAFMDGALWSIDETGELWKTDPRTIVYQRVGTGQPCAETRLMTCMGGHVWTVNRAGTLRKTDATGATEVAGGPGSSGEMVALCASDDRLFALEKSGQLVKLDFRAGEWEKLGSPGPVDAVGLVEHSGCFWSIDREGNLWKTSSGRPVPPSAPSNAAPAVPPGAVKVPAHSWKGFGVGSTAKYRSVTEVAGRKTESTTVHELTRTSPAAFSVRSTTELLGTKSESVFEFVVDAAPANEKVEKGKEKLKVEAGEFDCEWVRTTSPQGTTKVWACESVPGGVVRMETEASGTKTVLELVAFEKK